MFDITAAQLAMSKSDIDAWFIYDFRGNNPVLGQLLGSRSSTRRVWLVIPRNSRPLLLLHSLDKEVFQDVSFQKHFFKTWMELEKALREMVSPYKTIAMDYTERATIPTMSIVDAGTIELLRGFGVRIVSSSDLFQFAAAQWSPAAVQSHLTAVEQVNRIKDKAFQFVTDQLRERKRVTEFDVQEFIMSEFAARQLETEDRPIVAINENSGNPHYEPSAEINRDIKKNDWILIDLWARVPGQENVFADITWVGFAGANIPPEMQQVFRIVREARDKVVHSLQDAWNQKREIFGWELDQVAREHIGAAGYADKFFHRTGHSIGPGTKLHALGVNLDNYETHDDRQIVPGIGFSVEPGIYLNNFGVRLEINVYVDPKKGPVVTTPAQDEVIALDC